VAAIASVILLPWTAFSRHALVRPRSLQLLVLLLPPLLPPLLLKVPPIFLLIIPLLLPLPQPQHLPWALLLLDLL
jgi:hypothetical protein